MFADPVTQIGRAPWFVEGGKRIDPVTKPPYHHAGIVGEGFSGVAVSPASVTLQCEWQVPMIQRGKNLDLALNQSVDKPVVEVEPLIVCRAASVGDAASGGGAGAASSWTWPGGGRAGWG